MQEDDPIHTLQLYGLLDDLSVDVQIKKVTEIERVGQPDHRSAEVLFDLAQKTLREMCQVETCQFGGIRGDDRMPSGT